MAAQIALQSKLSLENCSGSGMDEWSAKSIEVTDLVHDLGAVLANFDGMLDALVLRRTTLLFYACAARTQQRMHWHQTASTTLLHATNAKDVQRYISMDRRAAGAAARSYHDSADAAGMMDLVPMRKKVERWMLGRRTAQSFELFGAYWPFRRCGRGNHYRVPRVSFRPDVFAFSAEQGNNFSGCR